MGKYGAAMAAGLILMVGLISGLGVTAAKAKCNQEVCVGLDFKAPCIEDKECWVSARGDHYAVYSLVVGYLYVDGSLVDSCSDSLVWVEWPGESTSSTPEGVGLVQCHTSNGPQGQFKDVRCHHATAVSEAVHSVYAEAENDRC